MKILVLTFALLWSMSGEARQKDRNALFEIAPLRAVWGQVSLRGEVQTWKNVALAASYDQYSIESQRDEFHDSSRRFTMDGIYYPYRSRVIEPFIGLGIGVTSSRTGDQSERDTITWVRYNSDEKYDRWVQESTIMTSQQYLGVRTSVLQSITAAISLELDQVLKQSHKIKVDQEYSSEPNVSVQKRAASKTSIHFHAGIVF